MPIKRLPPRADAAEHPSIVALMTEARPGESAPDVMRRKCRALVSRAKAVGWSGPPFDPQLLASIEGIKVQATDEDIEGDGCIFPVRGRLVIQYRRGPTNERRRFTICHEIAHTCFPDVFERVRFHGSALTDEAHKRFENLCDIGAAEILMPLDEFRADLAAGSTLLHAQTIGRRFVASIDATVRRVLDLTEDACAAVFLTDRATKDLAPIRGRMRVKYCWKSPSFRGYFPVGTLTPLRCVALGALPELTNSCPPFRETWWINDKPRSYYIQSLRLPEIPGNADYPQVLAMLHARKPRDDPAAG